MRPTLLPFATVLAAALATASVPASAAERHAPSSDPGRQASSVQAADPLVIAHRGASGYRPEHTIAAYRLAIRMGADYIEPDLVSTKDGVLVARHENEISGTTDIADHPEFASLRTHQGDRRRLSHRLVHRGLHARRAQDPAGGGADPVDPAGERDVQRQVRGPDPAGGHRARALRGPEGQAHRRDLPGDQAPDPTYFDDIGLSLEEPLVSVLRRYGLDRRKAPVFVQSFETTNLRELSTEVDVALVQLFGGRSAVPYDLTRPGRTPRTYGELATPAGLADIATYARGIGPDKGLVIPRNPDGSLGEPTTLVDDAHAAGLVVHAYTFRAENVFLPLEYRSGLDPAAYGDLFRELEKFFATGLDGVFADQPDIALEAREDFLGSQERAAS